MTAPRYTRYTLRLGAAARGRAPAATAGLAPEPAVEDWATGTTARCGQDPAALDYPHPEAVALLRGLGVGWQELDGGETLVFWLEPGRALGPTAAPVLARLASLGGLESAGEPAGWEDAWKAFHRPLTVGRLYLRPPWSPPRDDLLDVVVEAGMAFGTGGHATTRQCLEELQLIAPCPLLDLGCGSGVVSLAALRLGFAPVWGVDIDPVAVHEASENAARNGLEDVFHVADATDPGVALPAADTVVANIALAPILRLASLCGSAAPGDPSVVRPRHILLAGLLVGQRDETLAAFPGHSVAAARDDGEWLLLHLEAA